MGFCVSLALAFAAVLLLARAAFAQDAPELPELVLAPCPESQQLHALDSSGVPGMWFPRETARCMLGRLAQLQSAVPYFRLLEQRLQLGAERNVLQERRVELAVEQARVAGDALDSAVRRARRAERRYRPVLWVAIGAVLMAGLEALSVWAYSQVSR